MVAIEVIGPGGNVIDQVELQPGVAVRLTHSTVRLLADPELADKPAPGRPAAAADKGRG